MEDKQLAPDQSLDLIRQMVSQTRRRLTFRQGNLFLLWGYLLAVTPVVIYILLRTTDCRAWQWLWVAPMVIGSVITYVVYRRNKPHVRSYSDKIIEQIGGCVIIVAALMIFDAANHYWEYSPLAPIILIISTGIFITSNVIKNKYMEFAAGFSTIVSIRMLHQETIWDLPDTGLLQFAILIAIVLIGSGYALNKQVKRDAAQAPEKE